MEAKHLHRLTLILSLNELRVFLFIWKWTGALSRGDVLLTYDEFSHGRKKKKKIQGERLDEGCGIKHKKDIIVAVKSLEQKGCVRIRTNRKDKARIKKKYGITCYDSDGLFLPHRAGKLFQGVK